MKAIVVLAIVAIVSISAMPLVSADAGKDKPDTIFQKTADEITQPIEVEVKPLKKVDDFQKMSDGIAIGSQEAKLQTLRKTKTTDK